MVRKTLRYLPNRFQAKVTIVQKSKDIDKLEPHKLVRNLQTYKTNNQKKKKFKCLAIKTKHERCDFDTNSEIDQEVVTTFVKTI